MPFFTKLRGRSTKSMQRLDDNDDQHLHIGEIQSTNKQSNTATPPMDTNTNNNINKISYTMTESPHTYNPQPPYGRYNNNNNTTNSASSYQSQSSNASSESTTDISRESNKIFTSAFTTSNSFDLLLDGDNFNNVFPTVNNTNSDNNNDDSRKEEVEINNMGPEFFESNLISRWDDGAVNNTMNKEGIISEEEEDPPAILQQMSSNEVWFDSSTSFPNNSSINQQQQKDNQTRLVSPDTSQKLNPNHPRQLEEAVDSFTDFGSTNFFDNTFDTNNNNKKSSSCNGFEKNDDDDFFGNSWTNVDISNNNISLNESSNDPWDAEVSFSISKYDSIKDEESNTRKEFSSIPKSSLVWDDKEEENQHPLKSATTKDDSNIVSHISATAPSSQQQQNGISKQQKRHTRKKSGGSIGSNKSNSSAVDQILEQYKQKRRQKEKNRLSSVGRTIPITPNSGGSVYSGSGYSPGSSAASPRGVLVTPNNGVRKSASGACLSHLSNHSGGSSSLSRRQQQHRRNISNDSISRVIDNLTPSNRSPSPIVGTHYPPPPLSETSSIGILRGGQEDQPMNDDSVNITEKFLMANIEATIGPRGVAPDLESLSGRSGSRSHVVQQQPMFAPFEQQLQRPSSKNGSRRHRGISSSKSVNSSTSRASRASRTSFRTYQSTKSALSTMSKESKSVANDLFRLEAQLAEQVAKQQQDGDMNGTITVEKTWSSLENVTYSSSVEELNDDNYTTLGATPVTRGDAPFEIHAPAGKLGIVLSNNKFSQHPSLPTHVSAVRSSSILAGQVQVGDILMSIDGEDVLQLNAKEIMSIMARKSEQTRVLRFRPAVSSV